MSFSRATVILGVLLLAGLRAAHGQVSVVKPSVYATYGDYSLGGWSKEGAAYATLAMKNRHFFTVGYSDLRTTRRGYEGTWRDDSGEVWSTDYPAWSYHQRMATAGFLVTRLPLRLKGYYSHIGGDYDERDSTLYRFADTAYVWRSAVSPAGYADAANLGSVEFLYAHFPFEAGVEVAYYRRAPLHYNVVTRTDLHYGPDPALWDSTADAGSRVRVAKQTVTQVTLRLDWAANPNVGVSVRPNFSSVSDGRRLYSLYARASYAPHRRWVLRAGGFGGERACYFDNDLLVMYSQFDTQRGMVFAQVETRVWKQFALMAEYISTRFHDVPEAGIPGRDYTISYIVAGIKTQIAL